MSFFGFFRKQAMSNAQFIKGGFAFVLFLVFFLGLGFSGMNLTVNDWKDYQYLQDNGTPAEATILDLSPPALRTGNNITYAYEVQDSSGIRRSYEGTGNVIFGRYDELQNANTVSILFDPSNPAHSRVKDTPNFITYALFPLLALFGLVTLLGPFILITLIRLRHRKQDNVSRLVTKQ
jgi:hypothetical protein